MLRLFMTLVYTTLKIYHLFPQGLISMSTGVGLPEVPEPVWYSNQLFIFPYLIMLTYF